MKAALAHLDAMFAHLPQTRRLIGAKANLRLLMEERFSELVVHGYSPNEAIGSVISEYGNLDKMAQRLGIVEILRGEGTGGVPIVSGSIPAQRVVRDTGAEASSGAETTSSPASPQLSVPSDEGAAPTSAAEPAAESTPGDSGRVSPETHHAVAENSAPATNTNAARTSAQSANAALDSQQDRQYGNVLGASGYGVSGQGPAHSAGHYPRQSNLASDGRFLLFSVIFWILAAVIYFVWGFVFHGWTISWVILVIAAVIYCAAYFYLKSRS
ncbi:MAG: hypothetical protein Q4C87_12710 [Actinomycetaceae bacterium]|nr:hypothetical protein [Actinomycetaceae bacterium]